MHALPVSTTGLRFEDEHLRVAVGLRLGTPLCSSHQCQHCGEEVDIISRHGMSWRSEGRQKRHAEFNNIIHHALTSAHVPARQEPPGLLWTDVKQPDGVLVVPWRSEKSLWCGMLPVLTPLHHRIQILLSVLLVMLQQE